MAPGPRRAEQMPPPPPRSRRGGSRRPMVPAQRPPQHGGGGARALSGRPLLLEGPAGSDKSATLARSPPSRETVISSPSTSTRD